MYAEGEPIGVTGYVQDSKQKDMAWVAWLGILPKYRGNGYGRQILEATIDLIKSKGFNFARLYTSRKYNVNAQFLYKKVMDIEEVYTKEGKECEHYVVFTKSLCDKKAISFGCQSLQVKEAEKQEEIAILDFKKFFKSHISTLKLPEISKFEEILNTSFIHDFKAFERKTKKRMLKYFENKNYKVQVLQNKSEILAYAIFYESENCDYTLLDYFAVNSKYRSMNIGELFLESVCQDVQNVVVELEPFDWLRENDEDTRRAKFYEKCGFYFPKIDCLIHTNLYELCLKSKNNKSKSQLILEIYEMYNCLYRKGEIKLR